MTEILLAGALGLMALVWWRIDRRMGAIVVSPPVVEAPQIECTCTDYAPEIQELRDALQETRAAVAEGIQHVERVEKRIRGTVRRARKELADNGFQHDGLEAEAEDLRLFDGDGGEDGWVPPVQQDVGDAPSSIPGLSRMQLLRIRGLR